MAYKTYLPIVKAGDVADRYETARLIMTAGWQKRVNPVIHSLLMAAAQKKAEDMAKRNYFSHTSPDGVTPNEVARSVGYALPPWYPVKGNNLESLYMGNAEPEEPIAAWFVSPKHKPHLTGSDPFYGGQRAIGVGTAKGVNGRQYYVFMSAPI